MAQGGRHQGGFGSLDNGTARPVLSPDALVRSVNTEHHHGGAITVRPGRDVHGEIASQLPPRCQPVLDSEFDSVDGELSLEQTYYARAVYVTASGETDDLHSSDESNPGPATLEWVATANAARIAVPFHIRRTAIQEFGHDADGFITLILEQPDPDRSNGSPVDVCDPTIFFETFRGEGWPLYSRSPRLQDETHLGANPEAAEPLYHRTEPFARCKFYDPTTRTLTFDKRAGELGQTGWLDADLVDFMMPDRGGLPILSYNLYLSDDNINFFKAGTWNRGDLPIEVFKLDKTAVRAPSTRVDRSAPTVAAVDVKEKVQGKRGMQPVKTRLPAGVYGVRTTWTCGDMAVMGDPGWAERQALNGNSADRPQLRAQQETWPSREAYLTILDNQGIEIEPPPGPDINSGWNAYSRQLRPHRSVSPFTASTDSVLNFDGVVRTVGDTLLLEDFAYSGAIYYGNHNEPAASFSNAETFPDSPQASQTAAAFYDEHYDTSVIISGALDSFNPLTRGFPPGYPDIRETLDPDGNPYFTYASSRDDIPCNRHLWWFHLDAVQDAADISLTTHAVLRIILRVRPGKTDATLNAEVDIHRYIAGNDKHVTVRYWDDNSATWTVIKADMGLTNWFERKGFPIDWDELTLIQGVADTDARWAVFDLTAIQCVGFDVDEVQLELYRAGEPEEVDPIPSEDSVLQRGGLDPIKDDTYTLKNPLAYRTYLDDDSDPGVGEWESIRPDNTAQWPMVVASLPIVGKQASSQETKVNFIGSADSCFRDAGGGRFERIFQMEGMNWNDCMRHDWRFENYLNRVFILNEGDARWNYRFDGLATYIMGLPKPLSGMSLEDILDGFGTSQGETPEPTLYGDRCIADELFAGQIVSVNQPNVPEGEQDPGGFLVIGFDVEYYIVYKRYDPATGRSYVVRSEPAQFTRTLRVRGAEDFAPTLSIEGWLSPEAQTTHFEIYRNRFGTADYYLVSGLTIGPDGIIPEYAPEGIKITDEVVDPATGRVYIHFEDQIPVDDSDLTLPIDFFTGRPPAAVLMKFNQGRIFFPPQKDRTICGWTNITSPSGDINPEGHYVKHVHPPPVKESSAILCISTYNDNVVVSCNTGMVGVQGISDTLNSPDALAWSTLAADAGWMGPDAYCDVDGIQYGMTRQGPGWLAGSELNFVGPPIEGTLLEMVTTTSALFDVRCLHYRTAGRSQVWFTYRTEPGALCTKVLLFDEGVNSASDREQFWKVWTEMPAHGLAASRDSGGVEYPLMGGLNGRAYRHGLNATDAGLLIKRDLATRWFEAPTAPIAFMPWEATFYTSGQPDDVIFLDIWPDMTEQARNDLPIPVRMGGNVGLLWGDAVGGSGVVWGGDGPVPWTGETTGLGGVVQQIAYRLHLDWDTWPAGKARCISFETTGFNPFGTPFGPRQNRANAGALRR